MLSVLERIRIVGLHGKKTIDVSIDNNTLILVGENGSGKTTFLRLLFHVLSGRWLSLAQYRFEAIEIRMSGREFRISHEEISKGFEKADRRWLRQLPPSLRNRLLHMQRSENADRVLLELQKLSELYDFSAETMARQLSLFNESRRGLSRELQQLMKELAEGLDAQVLYLPTYRRIERELSSIVEGVNSDDFRRSRARLFNQESSRSYIELVEFGMEDVRRAVESVLSKIKDFARESLNSLTLKYLGDVVNREYLDAGMSEISLTSEETIRSVLDRIDESILTQSHKEHLFTAINNARANSSINDEHSKIITHYFLQLLKFQESLKDRERGISAFCDLCSEYITDKKFVYNLTDFTFSIVPAGPSDHSKKIELSDLSSGEKQIVSLFSHLYLSGNRRVFVLIDEPELSLSVPWQRRFLTDIRAGEFCAGLVAVTHSPFIYDNELRRHAHSIGEFTFQLPGDK